MNSDTHSWIHSFPSLETFAFSGRTFLVIRDIFAMGRNLKSNQNILEIVVHIKYLSCSRNSTYSPPSRDSEFIPFNTVIVGYGLTTTTYYIRERRLRYEMMRCVCSKKRPIKNTPSHPITIMEKRVFEIFCLTHYCTVLPILSTMEEAYPVANEDMCAYCFDVLVSHFNNKESPQYPFQDADCPMFVTLNTIDRNRKSLRGCIGTLSPRPLNEISYFVMSSAFRDKRFSPLVHDELRSLEVCVSLLVKYEDGSHYLDWEVGVHGIIIEFSDNGNHYSATYLPDVASEQGWTKEEAIESLVRKSGYRGKLSPKLLESIKLTRYQSSKASMSYEDYCRIRNGR
jgi:AMME syndrome candidate gene 1 protein